MIAYIDAASGASGDKLLAALLEVAEEVGAYSLEELLRDLASVVPEASVAVERVMRSGMSGSLLQVGCAGEPGHRHWSDIRRTLTGVPLPDGARRRAIRAFTLLAHAEAKVHGCEADQVHFHEVGATDSLVDMVGVALLLDVLDVTQLACGPVAVGSGEITTSHGVLAVPTPATAELLKGVPVYAGAVPGEATTPTGAALLVANVDLWGPLPPMNVNAIGYGAGTRDPDGVPNVLRVLYGESADDRDDASKAYTVEGVILLTTNVDHISPEAVAHAAEELLAYGARDVWQTPITMKKGRLAIELSVLTTPLDAEATARRMHELTGSLGVRRSWVERTIAPREVVDLETPWGSCRFKIGRVGNGRIIRPEHEDVARISQKTGLGYLEAVRVLSEYGDERLD